MAQSDPAVSVAPLIWLIVGLFLVVFGGTAIMRSFRRNLLEPHDGGAENEPEPPIDPWEEAGRRMPTPPDEPIDSFDA